MQDSAAHALDLLFKVRVQVKPLQSLPKKVLIHLPDEVLHILPAQALAALPRSVLSQLPKAVTRKLVVSSFVKVSEQ